MENKIILSIIIPSYQETEKQIMALLSSINCQVNIDLSKVEIIIVRDGTSELDLTQFNLFDMQIKQYQLKVNSGPGVARELGLENALGEYIMFCDADDVLQNAGILNAMLHEMKTHDYDILKTAWLEESVAGPNLQKIYTNHSNENTWLHGKMFKNKFLIDNNIKFHPRLRVHEDTYFLGITAEYTTKIGFLNATSYIWKWGENSITRKNEGAYRFDSAIEFLKACNYIHEQIDSRPEKYRQHMPYRISQILIYHYFILHSEIWKNHQEAIARTEKFLVESLTPYINYWLNADKSLIIKIYNEERNKHFKNGIEKESLKEWLIRIGLPINKTL